MGVQPPPGVLYLLVCGSPVARDVGILVDLAQRDGWEVCVITTPDGRRFVDLEALEEQTGHPVRSHYKNPGDSDLLPPPDAIIVAPATVNTINKWAAGIADTYALGRLAEATGRRVPVVVMPFVNQALAANTVYAESLARLRRDGVLVLDGTPDAGGVRRGVAAHPAGTFDLETFPWAHALAALAR